ncbi:hypothetical protein FHG87_003432 [Trinorchestia longiramus]|nr:hypothetical protein FHG87_003432 [Trinorchestia longiramus]
MFPVLKENLGKKPYKMMKHHELTEHHERMRAEKSRHTLNQIAQGTLPNLVLTYEKKFCIQEIVNHENDLIWSFSSSIESRIVTRRQNTQSVMVWTAVTATGRSPLVFVPCGVKLNSERYISLILESKLLPWATEHFSGFTMESSTEFSTITWPQRNPTWIQRNIPSFTSKSILSARSLDLNPLDFSVWFILEASVLVTPHTSLESLKAKLLRKWEVIPQEQIRVAL